MDLRQYHTHDCAHSSRSYNTRDAILSRRSFAISRGPQVNPCQPFRFVNTLLIDRVSVWLLSSLKLRNYRTLPLSPQRASGRKPNGRSTGSSLSRIASRSRASRKEHGDSPIFVSSDFSFPAFHAHASVFISRSRRIAICVRLRSFIGEHNGTGCALAIHVPRIGLPASGELRVKSHN